MARTQKIFFKKGQKIKYLVATGRSRLDGGKHRFEVKCRCGTIKWMDSWTLKKATSCGCKYREQLAARSFIHGHYAGNTTSKTMSAWRSMLYRCYNNKAHNYRNYGGRGIKVCPRWMSFANFLRDMGIAPRGSWLERKNNSLGYSRMNCKWGTSKEQSNNKRTTVRIWDGNSFKTSLEISSKYGIPQHIVRSRNLAKWSFQRIVSTPYPGEL